MNNPGMHGQFNDFAHPRPGSHNHRRHSIDSFSLHEQRGYEQHPAPYSKICKTKVKDGDVHDAVGHPAAPDYMEWQQYGRNNTQTETPGTTNTQGHSSYNPGSS
ncbi:MAG: hypothetical protein AAGC79_18180, partial [Pseudomonadota bacterium]